MWPPEDKEPLDMMDAREREEQYRVSVEWLYDMEDYNEWMHEEDYEVTLALTSSLEWTMYVGLALDRVFYFSQLSLQEKTETSMRTVTVENLAHTNFAISSVADKFLRAPL